MRRFEEGYREGLYDGGEGVLESLLPDAIVPGLTPREAMAAGVEAARSRAIPLLGPAEVHRELDEAVREGRPYALIRLGDGELLALAQETVWPASVVREAGPFLPFAGLHVPDLAARDAVAGAVRVASLVGVPVSRRPLFQPLLYEVWRAHGIDPYAIRLTYSTINYSLHEHGLLLPLLRDRRVLCVGNEAETLARALSARGLTVAGTVHPVRGFPDIVRVLEEASAHEFDIALISAGIPALPLCVHLAGLTGKVTIDFGHMAGLLAAEG